MENKFVGAFLGASIGISDERDQIDLHLSTNDGNFCIDTQQLTFKIKIAEGQTKIKNALSIFDRETADDIARWSLCLHGEIILPESLHCDHFYEKFSEGREIAEFLQNKHETKQSKYDLFKEIIEDSNPSLGRDSDSNNMKRYHRLINHLHRTMNLTQKRHDEWRICRKCDRISSAKDSLSVETYRTESNGIAELTLENEIEHYENTSYKMLSLTLSHIFESFIAFIDIYMKKNQFKLIAIGYPVAALKYDLVDRILSYTWNHLDAFPCFFETTRDDIESRSDSFARRAAKLIGFNNLVKLNIGTRNCVGVDSDCISLYSLKEYRISLLKFGGKKMVSKDKFDFKNNIKPCNHIINKETDQYKGLSSAKTTNDLLTKYELLNDTDVEQRDLKTQFQKHLNQSIGYIKGDSDHHDKQNPSDNSKIEGIHNLSTSLSYNPEDPEAKIKDSDSKKNPVKKIEVNKTTETIVPNRIFNQTSQNIDSKHGSNELNPAQSQTMCDYGYYNCIRINDQKKVCFKNVEPFEFDENQYSNECGSIINDLILLSKSFKDTRISFISSTPQGGGVALMRHAHCRFYRLLDMRVKWYVTIPVNKIYQITKKKFHNVLQGVHLQEFDFQSDEYSPKTSEEPGFLNEDDKITYEKWINQNSQRNWAETVFKESDIIVLDDHQTSGFAPVIRSINKKVKIIYRSHIQIRGEIYPEDTRIKKTWDYISTLLFDQTHSKFPIIDLFLAHPIKSFVPKNIPKELISYLPPSTDLLDGLNKEMPERICRYYQDIFDRACCDSGCSPIDLDSTDYLLQVSRFDASKGLIDCIEVFSAVCESLEFISSSENKNEDMFQNNANLDNATLKEEMTPFESQVKVQIKNMSEKSRKCDEQGPDFCVKSHSDEHTSYHPDSRNRNEPNSKFSKQYIRTNTKPKLENDEKNSLNKHQSSKKLHLIIAGHGSVDDPEGLMIFHCLNRYVKQEKFNHMRDRIRLVRIPPLDQCLNLLMTKAKIVLQLSRNEGFEVKVTEALLHQKPVVVSDAGGIPLQVFHNLSGFICKNRDEMVEKILFILQNYEPMLKNIQNIRELGLIHTTPFNIMAWLEIFNKILKNEPANGEIVYKKIITKYFKGKKRDMLLEKVFRDVE